MSKSRPRFRHRSFREQRHAVAVFVVVSVLVGIALVAILIFSAGQ